MKNDKTNYLLCLLFFAVLAAITFRCCWGPDMVFSASDLNIGRLAYVKQYLPESFTGFFTANQLLGNSGANFSLFKAMLLLMPAHVFGNIFYGTFLVVGSLAMVWFLRLWNRSWISSVVGALVAFWVNSVMLASGGHIFKIEVLVFSVLCLVFVEKAVRSACLRRLFGFSIIGGVCAGIMMIEQQDVALFAGLFVGAYAIFRLIQVNGKHWPAWVIFLVTVGGVALLLAGGTMKDSYKRNVLGAATIQSNSNEKWNFITQWSLVPAEWPDLVASGWGGWSSNNPKGPYWGKLGQSAEWQETGQGFRNFKLTSNYIGIMPFLLGAFGLMAALRNRKSEEGKVMLFWSVAGLIGLWLAFGKYSLLYKLFYHLPLVGNIRAPIKLLDNFQICLGVVAAYGLDRLLCVGKGGKSVKVLWISSSVLGGMMLLAGLKVLVFPAAQKVMFSQMGFGSFAETLVTNMANAWFHGALLAFICAGLVFVVWKGCKQARWTALLVVAMLAVDSLALTSHYFKASNIEALKKGNVVVNYIKKNQGNERTFFADSGGIYNQWLASDGPYHGLNLFNIWQMPRMSGDYNEFLGSVGRNQLRLWELAAIKYVVAPATITQQITQNPELAKQFNPVLNYQVPTAKGMRKDVLLEFKGAIPRFSLFSSWEAVPLAMHCAKLIDPKHDPRTTVLVEQGEQLGLPGVASVFEPLDARVSNKSARLEVEARQSSVVRFSQYYQPSWTVTVNGEPAKLLRLDSLCMGVQVPPGKHVVEFHCLNTTGNFWFSISVLVASLVVSVVFLRRKPKDAVA